ncbi:TIGR04540 family protein [Clostridium taeniosporum]|uniref:Ribonuclease P n=1 Tax=Clostridium taeniosporum TaxID=394958 RepID=A0A1D7XJP8_9CLOT|nr:TIGR04540 family protein [Clostridium taeniosporum]AOR23556.1 ribonuclease P [Clostridium taeniosporum]
MRTIYKNPSELATCLKDLVDTYLENLITYEKMEEKMSKILVANNVYKNGFISVKLSNIIGEERMEIINKIYKDMQTL